MKLLQSTIIGLLLVGSVVFLPLVSFADANEEQAQSDINLLRDSASALQQSRPDLATGLNRYADREAKGLSEMTKEKNEGEDGGGKVEPKDSRGESTKD